MNTRKIFNLLFIGLTVAFTNGLLFAQNPLRRIGQDDFQSQPASENSSASYYHEVYKQDSSLNYGNRVPIISPEQARAQQIQSQFELPRRHENVALAGFQEIPPVEQIQPRNELAQNGGAQVLGSAIDQSWQDPKQIVDLVKKISLNLIFVLCFAFGVILVWKKLGGAKGGNQNSDRAKSDSLTVLQTLRIDPKISIRLVQWRANRFLVSCDQNGIQSVNPLNESFEQTLKELDDETPTDEKLLQKLLSSLEPKNRG